MLIDPTPAVSLVECLYQLHADRKRAAGLLTMETNCRPYGEGGGQSSHHCLKQEVAPLDMLEPHIERRTYAAVSTWLSSRIVHHILAIRRSSEVPADIG